MTTICLVLPEPEHVFQLLFVAYNYLPTCFWTDYLIIATTCQSGLTYQILIAQLSLSSWSLRRYCGFWDLFYSCLGHLRWIFPFSKIDLLRHTHALSAYGRVLQ